MRNLLAIMRMHLGSILSSSQAPGDEQQCAATSACALDQQSSNCDVELLRVPRTTSQIPQDPKYFLSNMKILPLSCSFSPKYTVGFQKYTEAS